MGVLHLFLLGNKIVIALIVFVPKQCITTIQHASNYWILLERKGGTVDGEEVSRAPFTLRVDETAANN